MLHSIISIILRINIFLYLLSYNLHNLVVIVSLICSDQNIMTYSKGGHDICIKNWHPSDPFPLQIFWKTYFRWWFLENVKNLEIYLNKSEFNWYLNDIIRTLKNTISISLIYNSKLEDEVKLFIRYNSIGS